MKRLVVLFALLPLLAACGHAGDEPTVLPTDPGTLVAGWRQTGGFIPPGMDALRAPRLVVYGDGRAVVDALTVLTLSKDETNNLVGTLRRGLNGTGPTVTAAGDVQMPDAPNTRLEVLGSDGRIHTVLVRAMFEMDGFPATLRDAANALEKVADRVRKDGTPFTSDRVRLVAEARPDGDPVAAKPWPAGIPVPTTVDSPAWVRDLAGAEARAVRGLPGAVTGTWPELRLPDGSVVGVAWRYLLPDE